ncbi:hypothetical protein [Bifidobacterium simiiventris]|uniref:hypothetical protein n=1 Tax=Bifidobacterium simiiventris TaxID=2834434 RepID=UPI001C5808AB|nr:hypothetical protein [Bifidobacterium simiiventris]MBW3077680.1 hypothetical protein [Bifidobacterium simiiventris]
MSDQIVDLIESVMPGPMGPTGPQGPKGERGVSQDDLLDVLSVFAYESPQRFDISTAAQGKALDVNTGEPVDRDPYMLSDWISVTDYRGWYVTGSTNALVAYYDETRTWVKASYSTNITYVSQRRIPDGASWMRVSPSKSDTTFMLIFTKDKQTSTPEFKPYGKFLADDIRTHDVPEDQGAENAGRPLVVGQDGIVTLGNTTAEAEDPRLTVGTRIPNGGTGTGDAGDQTISIGDGACRDESCGIIAIGVDAAASTTSRAGSDDGHYSVAIGHRALKANTSGDHNTAVGWGAMSDNTAGDGNTALGEDALCHNKTGNANVAVGNRAYQSGTGSRNTVVGATAMYTSQAGVSAPSGDANVAVGAGAGEATGTGRYNTSVGTGAKPGIADGMYQTVLGAGAKSDRSRQAVIGSCRQGSEKPVETILNGDLTVCGTDGVFRRLAFNADGTVTWTDATSQHPTLTQ